MIQGVDIHPVYQRDYEPRAKDAFVFVKASEGSSSPAAPYPSRPALIDKCRRAGKIIGHYHWLHRGNVQAQVDHFASRAGVRLGDIIALDWEHLEPTTPVADQVAWVRAARARFPRNRIVVYTFSCYGPFVSSWRQADWADGLWIADYRTASADAGRPRACNGGPLPLPWLIWQYTTNNQTLDENRARFNTPAAMRAWANFDSDGLGFDPADVWKATIP